MFTLKPLTLEWTIYTHAEQNDNQKKINQGTNLFKRYQFYSLNITVEFRLNCVCHCKIGK